MSSEIMPASGGSASGGKKILPIFIVIVIVAAGAAFYGGMLYGKSTASGNFRQFAANGQFGGNINVRNRQPDQGVTNGQIIAKDDKSITVSLRTGGSKIVFFSDTTSVGKFVTGTAADLANGQTVMVTGTTNSDGSISASSIQIRPEMPANAPGGQNPQNPTNTNQTP